MISSKPLVRRALFKLCASYVQPLSVDPATSIAFPVTLRLPSKIALPTFTLVGVGVRTVSFLGIRVYSVGFYADLDNPNLNV
jgi:Chalcone isomerase like